MRDWYSRFLLVLLAAILLSSAVAVAQQRIYGTSSTGGAVPILVDASGALLISSVLTTISFEGSTDDAYETTITVVDPTADRTITFPNLTMTAAEFTTIVGVTAGTAAASKALVVDANVDITAGLRNIVGSGDAKFATFHVGTTAGADCTSADAVTVAKGIVTGCTDPDPTMTPAALLERIQQLEARLAALEGRRQ